MTMNPFQDIVGPGAQKFMEKERTRKAKAAQAEAGEAPRFMALKTTLASILVLGVLNFFGPPQVASKLGGWLNKLHAPATPSVVLGGRSMPSPTLHGPFVLQPDAKAPAPQ